MFYKIEFLEDKIVLIGSNKAKEFLIEDVKSAKIIFRDNTRAKILLLMCVSGVFIAALMGMNLGVFQVSLIILSLSYILFFEFDKISADLILVTKTETFKFNVQNERLEMSFMMIDKLHLKNYKVKTNKVYLFEAA